MKKLNYFFCFFLQNKPPADRLAYMIRNIYIEKWQKAANEAEQLKGKNVVEKMDFFEQLDQRRKLEKLGRRNDTSKRKRSDSINTICSDISQITDFQDVSPTRKKYKKDKPLKETMNKNRTSLRIEKQIVKANNEKKTPSTSTAQDKNTSGSSKTIEKSEPEPVVIPPYVPILDNENILPSRTRSGLNSEVNAEIIAKLTPEKPEKTEKSVKSETSDPFSLEAQRSLFRRNNLFKGVSKEKACQYCYQLDMVFKCTKGGCNGFYHLNCAVEVMSGNEYKKRRSKSKYNCFFFSISKYSRDFYCNTLFY